MVFPTYSYGNLDLKKRHVISFDSEGNFPLKTEIIFKKLIVRAISEEISDCWIK